MFQNRIVRVLFSLLLTSVGVILLLIDFNEPASKLAAFTSDVGLAFMVAGVFSVFQDLVLRRFDQADTDSKQKELADEIHNRLVESPPNAQGIRLIAKVRKGYSGYYQWALNDTQESLFFAGRSVLHRIDEDVKDRDLVSAEAVIAKRLLQGADIRVLFLDPTSDLVPRLAAEEAQSERSLLSDIAYSIGVCERLSYLLRDEILPRQAGVDIRIFDKVPYFAYHQAGTSYIIGFYFSTSLGYTSAAFEVIDDSTQAYFREHFTSIFAGSMKVLISLSPQRRVRLNTTLVAELKSMLKDKLGTDRAERLLNGKPPN